MASTAATPGQTQSVAVTAPTPKFTFETFKRVLTFFATIVPIGSLIVIGIWIGDINRHLSTLDTNLEKLTKNVEEMTNPKDGIYNRLTRIEGAMLLNDSIISMRLADIRNYLNHGQ